MKRSTKVLALLMLTVVCASIVDANGRFRRFPPRSCSPCEQSYCATYGAVCLPPNTNPEAGNVWVLYYCVLEQGSGSEKPKWKPRTYGIGTNKNMVHEKLKDVAVKTDNLDLKLFIDKENEPPKTVLAAKMVSDGKNVCRFTIAKAGALDEIDCDCPPPQSPPK